MALWEQVAAKLKGNASGTSRRLRSQQPSLLIGLVFDGEGRVMTPSHATKATRRYRYYVTRPDQLDGSPAWRVSGHDLEKLVCERLSMSLTDRQAICDLAVDHPAEVVQQALAKADVLAATLRSAPARERAPILPAIIQRIDLQEECIELTVDLAGLANALGLEVPEQSDPMVLLVAATKVRHGHQLRLVIPGPQSLDIVPANRDEKLVALLAEAHVMRQLILVQPDQSIASIAAEQGRCRTRLGKIAALACLAPDIVTAIVEGRQPATLTARALQDIDLPLAWPDQRALLGFS